jgi:hypothetical protein
MNKRFFLISIFVTLISLFQLTLAQTTSQSSVIFWGLGDYGNWQEGKNEMLKPQNVYGGGLGVGYESWNKSLILGIGAEVKFNQMNLNFDDFAIAIDSSMNNNAQNIFYRGDFYYMNIKDKTNYVNLQIPLYVGTQNKRFYGLVGGKISMNVSGTTTITYDRQSTGSYYIYTDNFINTPNYDFFTTKHEKNQDLLFNTAFIASLEAGIKFPVQDRFKKKPVSFRLGVFVNYTLNNMLSPRKESFIYGKEISEYPFQEPLLDNLLLSSETYKSTITPLTFGLKLSMVFRLSSEPCNCNWD